MVSILNNHIIQNKLSVRLDRVLEKHIDNMYSDNDAELYELDMNTLRKGNLIVKIDFERKPKDRFDNGAPYYWYSAHFLHRKVSKPNYQNTDLYILHDSDETNPKIIWTTFGTIREYGKDDKNPNPKNRFWHVPKKHYDKLNFGYDSFIKHVGNPKKHINWFG